MNALTTEEIETLIRSKSISDRTQAVRHFEYHGTVSDIEYLVGLASSDTSIAVRNNATDAIGDILSRVRLLEGDDGLSDTDHEDILKLLRRVKPHHTPAVFLAYAALGTGKAFNLLLSGFQDPRVEIQNCAAAGLRCFCLSQAEVVNPKAEERLLKLLDSGLLDIPGIAHVVRLCAEAGYTGVKSRLDHLPDLGALSEIVDAARLQFEYSEKRPLGLWSSQGLDAVEFNPQTDRGERFLLVLEDQILRCENGVWEKDDDALTGPSRRLFFRPIGKEESVQAVQTVRDTWVQALAGEVQFLLQQEALLDLPFNPLLKPVAHWLKQCLKDNPKNVRSLAILCMRAELWEECAEYVEKGLGYKKVIHELWYVDARRLLALGKKEQALDSLEKCVLMSTSERSLVTRLCQELQAEITANL